MAVAPTGAIYKAMTIDGESSRAYGVYITGQAVYNAPQREVEMISIPGRNGQLALDKGRFENLEVTYPAGIYANTEEAFAEAVSNFRSFLCSRSGYVRIEDEYNPNEYRMGIYKSGLEVETAGHKGGKFEIIFDCKPQRFLSSGETVVTVASGGTLTNPTLFESSPLLECKGYGNILVRGVPITIASIPIGNILLSNSKSFTVKNAEGTAIHDTEEIGSLVLDVSNLNSGDDIYLGRSTLTYNISINKAWTLDSTSVTSETGESWSTKTAIVSPTTAYFTTTTSPYTFKKGTSATKTYEYTMDWSADSGRVTYSGIKNIKLEYDGNSTITLYSSTISDSAGKTCEVVGTIGQVNGYSTKTATDTIYIDLDIGEAYRVSNNSYSSANYAVNIPAKLPTLKPGNNIITYDNTITNFKVTPRWWKV